MKGSQFARILLLILFKTAVFLCTLVSNIMKGNFYMSDILPSFSGRTITYGHMQYRILESLGSGAYGVVYLAQDLNSPLFNPHFYAVKCLLRHAADTELAATQEREIECHTMLSHHPNVITLRHVIVEDHYVFLVMDYHSGGDLFGAITNKGVYVNNDRAVKRTFLQLIDAVERCHDLGVSHRDLKPENILCSPDYDQVFLGDFGLATQEEVCSSFGCGSSYYMSAECLGVLTWRRPYCPRNSDVWSLGIILCNLLTGRNPWYVSSPEDRGFADFLKHGADFLCKILPISRSAACLLTRTFDPDPDVRYTLQELRTAVRDIDTFFVKPEPSEPTSEPELPHVDPSMEDVILTAPDAIPAPSAPVVRPDPTEGMEVSSFVNEAADADSLNVSCDPPAMTQADGSSRSDSPVESIGPQTPVSVAYNPAIIRISDLALSDHESSPVSKPRNAFKKKVLIMSTSSSKVVRRLAKAVHKVKLGK